VKLERRPDGGVRVVEFLSPDLTESERAELRDAVERGEARPETGPAPNASTWTTWVIRRR
jgi:cell division inhibitor SulA